MTGKTHLDFLQRSPHTVFSLSSSYIQIRGNGGTGDQLLAVTFSSIASFRSSLDTLPAKGGNIATSSAVEFLFNAMNDVAITWWIFNFQSMKLITIYSRSDYFCLPAMTSECIFKDTSKNRTQVFLNFKIPVFEICLHLISSVILPTA